MVTSPLVSICVIGRNEGANLPQLFADLDSARNHFSGSTEVIFVDSASTDKSIDCARGYADVVIELQADPHLNASAARWAGTAYSRGEWIFYLDGDMRVDAHFLSKVPISEIVPESAAGFFGRGAEIRDGVVTRENLFGTWLKAGRAPNFGGAVLLKRAVVEAAGGWNPQVVANEELDLYVRIRKLGQYVYFVDEPMIIHPAPQPPLRVRDIFWPVGSALKGKFGGFGQHLKSALSHGYLAAALRYSPLPFVMWLAVLASGGLVVKGLVAAGIALMSLAVLLVSFARKPTFVAIYLAMAVQAAYGWCHAIGNWRPAVRAVWRR